MAYQHQEFNYKLSKVIILKYYNDAVRYNTPAPVIYEVVVVTVSANVDVSCTIRQTPALQGDIISSAVLK